jgi:hypothetical protein
MDRFWLKTLVSGQFGREALSSFVTLNLSTVLRAGPVQCPLLRLIRPVRRRDGC